MKQIILLTFLTFLYLFLPFTGKSVNDIQAVIFNDSIDIIAIPDSGALDYQINIQNANNLSESVVYWSNNGTGTFALPFCNVRVSRTVFYNDLTCASSNYLELTQQTLVIKVSAMPNRRVKIESNVDFKLTLKHWAYGNNYLYSDGSVWNINNGSFVAGTYIFYIPYRIPGFQLATLKINDGVCSKTVSKLFTLN